MKIKNENDFLGFLVSIKNEKNSISVRNVLDQSGLSDIDCSHYFKSLQTKGYVRHMDSETYHIYPDGISAYISPAKRTFHVVGRMLVLTIKELFVFLSGVASGLLVAYLIWKFGWYV